MTIAVLSEFIGRLAAPVSVLSGSTLSAAELERLARALLPFAHFDVSAFNDFLVKAEHYHKTGEVPREPARLVGLRKAVESLEELQDKLHDIDAVLPAQNELAGQLDQLGKAFGVTMGKPKVDAGWIATRQQLRKAQPTLERFRMMAERIIANEPISSDVMQDEIRQLATIDESQLLVIAGELGVGTGTKAKPIREKQLVLGILSALSGKPLVDQPKRAKSAPKPKVVASAEQVADITKEVLDTIAKSANPDQMTQAEIDELMRKVEKGNFSDAQLSDLAFQVNGTRPKGKKKLLQAIREKLNESRLAVHG